MIVKCSGCNASFSVDDDKISGKKFAFDCPNCSHHNIIDNRPSVSAAHAHVMPAAGTVPGFSEEDLTGDTESMVSDEFEFDDDLEPEFDLSVLNKSSAGTSFAEDEADDELSADSESIPLDDDTDDFNFDDLDLPAGFSGAENEDEKETGVENGIDFSAEGFDFNESDEFKPVESDEEDIFSGSMDADASLDMDDDSTTIDLDSLDIDLDADEENSDAEPSVSFSSGDETSDSDDLTLDLDSLDINLEESDEIQAGEDLDDSDDARLSLEDAGLSLDELTAEEDTLSDEDTEDELRLSIDEIPGLDVDELAASSENDDMLMTDEDELRLSIDEIPGLDVDELAAAAEEIIAAEEESEGVSMDFDDIPEMGDDDTDSLILEEFSGSNLPEVDLEKYEAGPAEMSSDMFDIDMENIDEFIEDNYDHNGRGFINFSIDYSLRYSRIKALLRLLGLYYIVFIPHAVVNYIYNMLSTITGVLNWILILFSGRGDRDFYAVQEKTLRYNLHLSASVLDIIEENPRFAGNTGLDDSLQMKAALPEKPSRFLAAMRLSGAGILFLALPHLVLLMILSFGIILFWVIGILAVIITGKWPNILFDFMVRYLRYSANVCAFLSGLSDSYPSFRFD